jgi:hypothetical protein
VDKDLIKGLLLLLVAVAVVLGIFLLASGPRTATCIANALKSGVPYANIDKTCNLTKRSY